MNAKQYREQRDTALARVRLLNTMIEHLLMQFVQAGSYTFPNGEEWEVPRNDGWMWNKEVQEHSDNTEGLIAAYYVPAWAVHKGPWPKGR